MVLEYGERSKLRATTAEPVGSAPPKPECSMSRRDICCCQTGSMRGRQRCVDRQPALLQLIAAIHGVHPVLTPQGLQLIAGAEGLRRSRWSRQT